MAFYLWVFVSAVFVVLGARCNIIANDTQEKVCKTSEAELDELVLSLEKSIADIDVTEKTDSLVDSSCGSMKQAYIQNFGKHLVTQQMLLKKFKDIDAELFRVLNEQHEELVVRFNGIVEIILGREAEEVKNEAKVSQYRKMVENYQERVNDISVTSKLNPFAENLIKRWVKQVKAGDLNELKSIFTSYNFKCESPKSERYNNYLPQVVHEVYNGSIDNFNAILKMIDVLDLPLSPYICYEALFKEMVNSGHKESRETLQLIYRIKSIPKNFLNRNEFMKVGKLQTEFPDNLYQIIWGVRCTIKNDLYGEYMYSDEVTSSDYGKRDVFLQINRRNKEPDQEWFKWQIIPIKNATAFVIVNKFWEKDNKNLHAFLCLNKEDSFDSERINVWTNYRGSKQAHRYFQIHPVGNKFRLLSVSDEMDMENFPLYAEEDAYNFDGKRRRVFAWSNGTEKAGDLWEISCR